MWCTVSRGSLSCLPFYFHIYVFLNFKKYVHITCTIRKRRHMKASVSLNTWRCGLGQPPLSFKGLVP